LTEAEAEFTAIFRQVLNGAFYIGVSIVAVILSIALLASLCCLWDWARKYWDNIETEQQYTPDSGYKGYRDEGYKYENTCSKKQRRKKVNQRRKQARRARRNR